jgi:signal transduction histidine kinase
LKQKDEFGLLATELNAMSGQLVSTLEQLRHADRLTTVGQLASGVAHELGTPLNVVLARAGMIAAGDTTPEETKEYARVVVGATERMAKIIRQLLQFARRKGPQRAPTDMRGLVRDVLDLLAPLAAKRGVSVAAAGSDVRAEANVEVGELQQVITNLVMNAVQATPSGGKVEVTLTDERARAPEADAREQSCLCMRVKDTGAGIAAEHIPRIFEPFFTTKDVGEGTGLGLAVTYGIVRDHGGWISVDSAPGSGTTFAVFLPHGD